MESSFQQITISGTPRERGRQYGQAMGETIRRFLGEGVARLNWVRSVPLTEEQALRLVDEYIPHIERDVPDLAEEVLGLSEGAEISYRQAMLLQVRRELLSRELECSAVAGRDRSGQAVIAQNVDLPGQLTDLGIILRVEPRSSNEPELLMYTHAGLIGYLGINSHGIGVGLNMVLAPGWRPGVPPYLLIRHLLHQRSLDDCLREIGRIRRASSRNLLLSDGVRVLDVEMTVDEERVLETPLLLHTNHFLHGDFCPVDLVSPSTSTYRRLDRLQHLLAHNEELPHLSGLQELLGDHDQYPRSICAHGQGDATRGETVASAILYPGQGVFYAAKGNPCEHPYVRYQIKRGAR